MTTFSKRHGRYVAAARGRGPTPAAAAMVELMCLAACVDGWLEDGEAVALAGQIAATPGFEGLNPDAIATTVREALDRLAKEGLGARIKAIAQALGPDPQVREEAFALATLFALYDGQILDEEQALLDSLQHELRISDERAARVSALFAEA